MSSLFCSAFLGERLIATGPAPDVALAAKRALAGAEPTEGTAALLVFDDRTGRVVDLDLRGSEREIADRLADSEVAPPRGRGRPKLGVVSREITLLPRHWDWLAGQPSGPSGTIRRLVDAARAAEPDRAARREAQAAADGFMRAMLGDRPGYEDASRALYAGDRERFEQFTSAWPTDPRDHARRLAAPAFAEPATDAPTS